VLSFKPVKFKCRSLEADEKSKRNEDNDKNMYNSDITHHTRSVRCSRSAVDCHPTVSAGVKARARKRRLGTALSLTALGPILFHFFLIFRY